MEVTGKVKYKSGDIQVSASFKKSELVVTTDEQYPQHILIEFNQDKCDLIDPYNIGDLVKVSINLRGREWVSPSGETRYFNSIQGWRIERVQSDARQTPVMPSAQAFAPPTNINDNDADDLPF